MGGDALSAAIERRRRERAAQHELTAKLRLRGTSFLTPAERERVAEANRLSRSVGLPPEAVEANLDQVRSLRSAEESAAHVDGNPRLAQWYSDPRRAAVSGDDAGALSRVARALNGQQAAKPARRQGLAQGMRQFLSGVPGSLRAGLGTLNEGLYGALQAAEELDPVTRLKRWATGGPTLSEQFVRRRAAEAKAYADANRPKVGNRYARAALQGVESIPSTAGALALTLAGQPSAGLALMGTATSGTSYREARKEGLSPMRALPYAASQGAVEVATERAPILRFFGDTKAGSPFFRRLVNNLAQEAVGEQAATLLQDLNKWAVIERNKGRTFGDYLKERPSAALDTLIATSVGVLSTHTAIGAVERTLDGGAKFARRVEIARQSRREAAVVQEIMKAAEGSKLRTRDDEAFAEFVGSHANGTPLEHMYIPVAPISRLETWSCR